MEAIYSSETSVATQHTTRRHIQEDDTLHNHRCEDLKSYIFLAYFSYSEKVKGGLWDHLAVSLPVHLSVPVHLFAYPP
jgi:hypothetical protein